MKRLPVDLERKIGMIKAVGYVVELNQSTDGNYVVVVGNDLPTICFNLANLELYIDIKYEEIVK